MTAHSSRARAAKAATMMLVIGAEIERQGKAGGASGGRSLEEAASMSMR